MEHLPKVGADARTLEQNCPDHGPYESRNILSKVWSRCPTCENERRERQEAREAEEERQRRESRQRRLLGRAAIPGRFIGKGFDNFNADTDGKRGALTALRDYAENFDSPSQAGKGLILSGKPGTGKSHLAGAVLQTFIEREVLYATCMDLIRMIRETWRKDSEQSERQVLAYLGGLDLLAIDEMGVQYGTESEQTILFDVLDRRYREVKPTILLTNQDAEGLKAYLGERTFDRVRETSRWVSFDWESFRPQARRESQA